MRKPDFCIYENKDADQLRGNREADPHRIDGNRERKNLNKFFIFDCQKNVFDCQNRYYGNRKHLICIRGLPF